MKVNDSSNSEMNSISNIDHEKTSVSESESSSFSAKAVKSSALSFFKAFNSISFQSTQAKQSIPIRSSLIKFTQVLNKGLHNLTLGDKELGRVAREGISVKKMKFVMNHAFASGSVAEVFEGRHQNSDEPVAIKVIDIRGDDKTGELKDFRREVALHGRIKNNPSVVHLHDAHLSKDADGNYKAYLVLEKATGKSQDLFDFESGDTKKAIKLFTGMAEAVHVCHEHGIVHRDIKPDNFLYGENEQIMLCDFGLASDKHDTNSLRQPVGSKDWAAPEVVDFQTHKNDTSNLPTPTIAADVYSLGQIINMVLVASETKNEELHALVSEMKQQDPQLRPSMGAVVESLKGLLNKP